MSFDHRRTARRTLIAALAAYASSFALLASANAQSINSGASPTLRGTLTESTRSKPAAKDADGVSQTVVIGVAGGYTSNAGPTFDETPSPEIDASVLVLHSRPMGEGRLSLQVDLTDREVASQSEARTAAFGLKGAFAADEAGVAVTIASTKSIEIDEEVMQTSLKVDREWRTAGQDWTPFWSGSLAYLDYADVNMLFLEFANQDDRDRLSASSQTGVKFKASDAWTLVASAGVDAKKYRESRDDFLIDRDNASIFASLGAAYEGKAFTASLAYAPVYRIYDESQFGSLLAHTFSAQASLTPADWFSASASARYGLEETDFLDARVMEEFVAVAGLTVTHPDRTSATLEAAYTHRYFDRVERIDQKYELLLRAQTPIADHVKLTAQIGYLLFATNIGDLTTDQTTALLGVVYTLQ